MMASVFPIAHQATTLLTGKAFVLTFVGTHPWSTTRKAFGFAPKPSPKASSVFRCLRYPLSIGNDCVDSSGVRDVQQRIGVQKDQVSSLARSDGAYR